MSNHLPTYTPPDGVRKHAEALVSTWPRLSSEQQALIGSVIGGAKP